MSKYGQVWSSDHAWTSDHLQMPPSETAVAEENRMSIIIALIMKLMEI